MPVTNSDGKRLQALFFLTAAQGDHPLGDVVPKAVQPTPWLWKKHLCFLEVNGN